MSVKKRLEEMRARLEATTPGPWKSMVNVYIAGAEPVVDNTAVSNEHGDELLVDTWGERAEANAIFIAHAPDDMAYLLDHVERLEAENKRLRDVAEDWGWRTYPTPRKEFIKQFSDRRPGPCDLSDYWAAPGGDGDQVGNWDDKPHRLLDDLLGDLYHTRIEVERWRQKHEDLALDMYADGDRE